MQKLVHIAIIMDGNRRWAKKQGLKAEDGHKVGIDALEKIVNVSPKLGIKFLTVYALSTENFKNRGKLELSALFSILQRGFLEKLPVLKEEGVRVRFLGQVEKLPLLVRKTLRETEKALSQGKGLQLNIAINYGSRAEVINAVERLDRKTKLSEEIFASALDTNGTPDPDLIIRTGGEKRLSNFLLWQGAYSELYFTEELWPDFDEESLKTALADFEQRKRNFGS